MSINAFVWHSKKWNFNFKFFNTMTKGGHDEIELSLQREKNNKPLFTFSVRWYDATKMCCPDTFAQLEIPDDSWGALTVWPDLFEWLSRNKKITPEEFVKALSHMGFEDRTEYKEPLQLGDVRKNLHQVILELRKTLDNNPDLSIENRQSLENYTNAMVDGHNFIAKLTGNEDS